MSSSYYYSYTQNYNLKHFEIFKRMFDIGPINLVLEVTYCSYVS